MHPALNPANWGAAPIIFLGRLLARLPHALALKTGARIGTLAWRLSKQRRTVTTANIQACFPALSERQQQSLVKQSFVATGQGISANASACWGSDRQLAKLGSIAGLEHLQAARARGKGVLVLLAHYPWLDLAGRLVNAQLHEPILGMARSNNNDWLDHALRKGRQRHCGEVFAKGQIRGLLRALRGGQAVFYAADQNFNHDFVFASFFGVPASCVTALGELANRTDCAIVPMWCRLQEQSYQIELFQPWTEPEIKDPQRVAQRMNDWIEACLRDDYSQYLWLHRRFKNQPAGAPPFYPTAARRKKHRD